MKLYFALLAILPASAMAGDLLTFKKIEKKTGLFRLYLEPHRLKVDIFDKGTEIKNTMIYDKDKQTATILDHSKKTYMDGDGQRKNGKNGGKSWHRDSQNEGSHGQVAHRSAGNDEKEIGRYEPGRL